MVVSKAPNDDQEEDLPKELENNDSAPTKERRLEEDYQGFTHLFKQEIEEALNTMKEDSKNERSKP